MDDLAFAKLCFALPRWFMIIESSTQPDIEMNEIRVGLQGVITNSKGLRPRELGPTASFN